MDNIPVAPIEENNQTQSNPRSHKSIWISLIIFGLVLLAGTLLLFKEQSPTNTVSDTTPSLITDKNLYRNDGQNVYHDGNKIPDADPATFTVLSDYYTKDKNAVYWYGKKIPDADPATFVVPDED